MSLPDQYYRHEFPALLDTSRGILAGFLNVPVDEVVFVPNATVGVNTVLRALRWKRGDVMVYFATIYGACEKTIQYLVDTMDVEAVCVLIEYPMSDDAILKEFESVMVRMKRDGKNPRISAF